MATDASHKSRIRGAGSGIFLSTATWLVLGALGVPAMLGLGTMGDLAWIALAGAALGALGLLAAVWTLLGVAVVCLFAVSWFPFLDNRIQRMVRADELRGREVDAVVVLSGSVTSEGRIGNGALERLVGGVLLRRSLSTRHLVLTTIRRVKTGDTVSSEQDQRSLVARLDPEAALDLVGPVRNTHDEAVGTAGLARQRGWQRIAVVTSSLHTRRACAAFEAQGLTVLCRPSDARDYSLNLRRAPGDRLGAFRDWLYELVASKVYRARGWLPSRRAGDGV